MKFWVARSKRGYLTLFSDKPKRYIESKNDRWLGQNPEIPPDNIIILFESLKWNDEPVELKLVPVD